MKNIMSYFFSEMKLTEDIQIQQSVLRLKKKKSSSLICQAEHLTADLELSLY